jgi:DNA-directed RNA polymerase specialized sigma24 family protein
MASSTALETSTTGPEVIEKERGLSHRSFSRLLEWLDDGVDSHGAQYLEMRRRLVSFFDRRDRRFPDELADETLNRVARTLEEDGAIKTTPQARYCYVVARFVMLEDVRKERVRLSRELRYTDAEVWDQRGATLTFRDESLANHVERLECLDRCLEALNPKDRALIVEYYRDARQQKIARRRGLAKRLGITMNALGIRASRIRAAVERRMEALP